METKSKKYRYRYSVSASTQIKILVLVSVCKKVVSVHPYQIYISNGLRSVISCPSALIVVNTKLKPLCSPAPLLSCPSALLPPAPLPSFLLPLCSPSSCPSVFSTASLYSPGGCQSW